MKAQSVTKPVEIRTAREQQIGEGVDLGMWLGRRQAFTLMAGRRSVSDGARNSALSKIFLQLVFTAWALQRGRSRP